MAKLSIHCRWCNVTFSVSHEVIEKGQFDKVIDCECGHLLKIIKGAHEALERSKRVRKTDGGLS